ncbi:hypothetical protein [Chitinimonas lacunae]|uniref:Uncharacterized protein n=1 Tax=Chitinimonas lacunae TaxID=1963018 RepID=A0ABV8MQV0_9NEIS
MQFKLLLMLLGMCGLSAVQAAETPVVVETPNSAVPATPPATLAQDAEIALVSGYEPKSSDNRVQVLVDRPGKSVVLVLTSYEKIMWHVTVTPNTKLQAVLFGSYKKSQVTLGGQTKLYRVALPYAYEAGNQKFVELLGQLNQWFGVRKVDAFYGAYSLPAQVQIRQTVKSNEALALDGPASQPSPVNFSFDLVGQDYSRVKWTPSGPAGQNTAHAVLDGRIVLSPDGATVYQVINEQLVLQSPATQAKTVIEVPGNYPDFSWVTGLAYDSRRQTVAIATLGGEGFLYRFDAAGKRWLGVQSLNNLDLHGLSYDAKNDRYLAWERYQEQLVFLTPKGQLLDTHALKGKLAGFERLFERGNSQAPELRIFPQGNHIALLYIKGPFVERIWVYDTNKRTAVLTYQRPGA